MTIKRTIVSVRLSSTELSWFDWAAKGLGMSRGKLMRTATKDFLNNKGYSFDQSPIRKELDKKQTN